MRAIKFRGRNHKGEWLYGDLMYNAHKKEQASILYVPRVVNFPGQIYNVPIIKDTIGQFTGLHDANGKEIYEGDILRDSSGFTAVVVAYKGAFRLLDNKSQIGDIGPAYNLLREYDFSIIGNICDNKDLLK